MSRWLPFDTDAMNVTRDISQCREKNRCLFIVDERHRWRSLREGKMQRRCNKDAAIFCTAESTQVGKRLRFMFGFERDVAAYDAARFSGQGGIIPGSKIEFRNTCRAIVKDLSSFHLMQRFCRISFQFSSEVQKFRSS